MSVANLLLFLWFGPNVNGRRNNAPNAAMIVTWHSKIGSWSLSNSSYGIAISRLKIECLFSHWFQCTYLCTYVPSKYILFYTTTCSSKAHADLSTFILTPATGLMKQDWWLMFYAMRQLHRYLLLKALMYYLSIVYQQYFLSVSKGLWFRHVINTYYVE